MSPMPKAAVNAVKRTYGEPLPNVDLTKLIGALLVIEGPDSSGRSTQIRLLTQWLQQEGYAVASAGLTRSALVGRALDEAKQGNVLSPRTMSLFYATDFYDQLENSIIPALRAGYIVLADRYIYTLMARDLVRGADRAWLESLYAKAIVPDAVYLLNVSVNNLAERTLAMHQCMDYWESGMDLGLSRDWYDSFIRYQRRLHVEYLTLQRDFGFEIVNGNRGVKAVQKDLRQRIEKVLAQIF